MPPLLEALWIADCASDSQLDEVLEAIDCVDPMADCRPAVAAVLWLVEAEEDDDEPSADVEEVPRNVLG
jgi:hypothetical protein